MFNAFNGNMYIYNFRLYVIMMKKRRDSVPMKRIRVEAATRGPRLPGAGQGGAPAGLSPGLLLPHPPVQRAPMQIFSKKTWIWTVTRYKALLSFTMNIFVT